MKLIYVSSFLLMVSCGDSETNDSGSQDFEATDSIKEFEMNEGRLSAVDFNNELTLMQERTLDLVYTLFQSDSATIELNLENTLFDIDVNLQSLAYMDSPKSGEEYSKTMMALMDWYKEELNSQFTTIVVPLLKKPELSKKDQDKLLSYDLDFAAREKNMYDSVFVAQENFAKANNIKLEE